MDTERLRLSAEVWWVRWSGRLRTLARFAAVLAVAVGGATVLGLWAPVDWATGALAIVAGLVGWLVLSVFPRR